MDDTASVAQKTVLHVGCGSRRNDTLHPDYKGADWLEIRLDMNPDVRPDIVASMTDMSAVPSDTVDAIWSSHSLEHVYTHEVPIALAEFFRVLKPGGHAFIKVPDLERAAELVLKDGPFALAYQSPSAPVTPIDMIYGHSGLIARGEVGMQHFTGFTAKSLLRFLYKAGFRDTVARRKEFEILARGDKPA